MKLNGHQWLMSNIVAEQEAEASAERERIAEVHASLKAVANFKQTPIAPSRPVVVAAKPKPGSSFRVTSELLDKHDAAERKSRISQFRASAGIHDYAAVRHLINAINTTNF